MEKTLIKILVSSHCEETSEADPNDDWDRPDTRTYHEVLGARLTRDTGEYVEGLRGSLQAGEKIYALIAIYSTGDSFGHDEDYGFEVVNIFRTKEAADYARKTLDEAPDNGYDFKPVQYLNTDGDLIDYHRPWTGYFERLTSLEVYELEVEPYDSYR